MLVSNKAVSRIAIGQQLDHFRIWCPEVLIEDTIFWIGPSTHVDDQVVPVVGHFAAEEPILMIGPLVSQLVLRLRRPELVKEKLLIVTCARSMFSFLGWS